MQDITFNNYQITFQVISENKVLAKCINTASKAFMPKPEFYYSFTPALGKAAAERALDYVTAWVDQKAKNILAKETQKLVKQTARAAFQHSYKVGDVLYCSWGYEQTNIDFYEIVEVKGKSVVIREIAAQSVPGTEGFMSDKVVPAKGQYTGEAIRKTVQVYVNRAGEASGYVPFGHRSLNLYTHGTDGVYRSWYA